MANKIKCSEIFPKICQIFVIKHTDLRNLEAFDFLFLPCKAFTFIVHKGSIIKKTTFSFLFEIVLCLLVFIYFIFNITSIANVFMLSIEKKIQFVPQKSETFLLKNTWLYNCLNINCVI